MRKHVIIAMIALSLIATGCATPRNCYLANQEHVDEPTELVNEYFVVYTNSTDMSNVTISSMLRYSIEYQKTNNASTWDNITSNLYAYVDQTTNLYINVNYPIKATQEEALFLRDFTDENIKYGVVMKISPSTFPLSITHFSTQLIKRMNEYEYNRYSE